ncbi:hypothetical protein CPB97_004901 [Podila verticillata]|nr:hypothetical protein CPB97_004901 [Podila verticillata]
MDDNSMDEALDFSVLSLHPAEERLQMTFEHSLHIHENDNDNIDHEHLRQQLEHSGTTTEDNTDSSGPWAKLPSTLAEMNPYQPGVNAQKLDAMAMDPNHVFKSSSISFPLTEPTSPSNEGSDKASAADKEDRIPDWMLADPEMVPNWMRNAQSTSAAAEAAVLDWSSSGPDLSTTVDVNSLFGFSSHPTFESLAISREIASELQRRQSEDEGASGLTSTTSSSTKTREGGFARFGNAVQGDGAIAPTFGGEGRRGSASEQGSMGGTPLQTGSGSLWNTWRSNNGPMEVEVDVEDEYDDHFNSQPTIKVTPGFAPAHFRRDSA